MSYLNTLSVLRIDASARRANSVTRDLNDQLVAHLNQSVDLTVVERDLAVSPLPQIDEAWVEANFTPADDRTERQTETLALSETLVSEIEAADVLLIGLPIYNFNMPTALKAWIDLIARAGRTFRYTPDGPKGLLDGKRAIVTVASGGTKPGSAIDFATPYLRHALGFVGITDVTFVTKEEVTSNPAATLQGVFDTTDNSAAAA